MRKPWVWMLTAAALALMLAGCGQEPQNLPESEPETVLPAESEAEQVSQMPTPDPQDLVFVAVTDYIPEIRIDLKYATEDNFTGEIIYEFSTVYLRYGTVEKLAAVQEDLRQLGLGLKIWDGFRPVSAQYRLWEVCPDSTFVANPETGFSSHSTGNTVDVTLVDSEGREVQMPTGFDDFSALADRDYSDCSETAANNARILEALMEKHGFSGYSKEWWHYTDTESYPVEEAFQPTR